MDFKQVIENEIQTKLGSALSTKNNISTSETSSTVSNAVTAILGGLQHNASTPEGAHSLDATLDKNHSSASKDSASSLANGELQAEGAKILGHIFGTSTDTVTGQVAKSSGVSTSVAQDIITAVGPLILGHLGQAKKSKGLDANDISNMLTKQKLPEGGVMGAVTSLLDSNHDGNVVDDIFNIGKGLFGKK